MKVVQWVFVMCCFQSEVRCMKLSVLFKWEDLCFCVYDVLVGV